LSKKNEYIIFLILLISGYSTFFFYEPYSNNHTLCLFKNITKIPCPGCGMYRGTYELLNGNFLLAHKYNILVGFINLFFLIFVISILYDIAYDSKVTEKIITIITRNKISLLLIFTVIIISWLYNILKIYP